MDQFIIDCISRELSLKDVAEKYQIDLSDILNKYKTVRLNYTDEEINKAMCEVYYNVR